MPTISMFYGIIIRMYNDDHNPPHFHVKYQEHTAVFDFDGNIIEGRMPKTQINLIVAWCTLHKDELIANWELVKDNQPLYKIDPLR